MSSAALVQRAPGRALTARLGPRLGLVVAVSGVAVAVSAVAALSAPLALMCAAAPAAALVVPWLRGRTAWALFIFALGGVTVLGYGFANVPALPSAPIPLVDVLLVGTFLGLVLTGVRWPVPRAPFLIAVLLFCWASLRLTVDFPTWGSFALRDYTTYVELSALFVGYWLMERVGLERWIRALSWIFLVTVIYGLMQFDGGAFSTFNIVVGLQRPVALLGHATGVASVSAQVFHPRGRPASGEIAAGVIRPAQQAILRCASDPNRPENGVLSFDIREAT